jgi:hypothetical protein
MDEDAKHRRLSGWLVGWFLFATIASGGCDAAPGHSHAGAPPKKLGTVHFETSCAPAVAQRFDRAMALLHSFEFPEAMEDFRGVLRDDASCAIADWGIALSLWDNPFAGHRTPKTLRAGAAAVQQGLKAGAKTERERDYLAATAELYREADTVDEQTRTLRYEERMQRLAQKYPADAEAQVFYALALNQTAPPSDKTYAKQLQAAAILGRVAQEQPDHPGAIHYLIHTYDVPPLASRGLSAARRYASIAPAAPHALHMPSHIFTRVGDWPSSIIANIASAEASRTGHSPGELLHALDYLAYAYLQTSRDIAAKQVLEEMQDAGSHLGDWRAHAPASVVQFFIRRASPAAAFALAAIPARYALEREDWTGAKALEVHTAPEAPYADAITRFALALGFARSGDPTSARREIAELERLRDRSLAKNDPYWAEQIEIQRLAASSWAARAEGKQAEAVSSMVLAAQKEAETEKNAVTPGPLKPAREQLGQLLLELNQPARALEEFEATLTKEPNRFRAMAGAARAAEMAGDGEKARRYSEQLLRVCANADTERPELQEARRRLRTR